MCADIVKEGVLAYAELSSAAAARYPVLSPPAWTRLEPQTLSGEPAQALAARIHDPLWLLARQWQFGEFDGEDAGTPVAVDLSAHGRPLNALMPQGHDAHALGPADLIEPEVEAEPFSGASLRDRVEAGALLAAMLSDAGADVRDALIAACPLSLPAGPGPIEPMWAILRRKGIDGTAAAKQIEDSSFSGTWGGDIGASGKQAAQDWLDWFRTNIEPSAPASDSWQQARLEYDFSIRAGIAADQRILRAPQHDGGAVDWYSFDHENRPVLTMASDAGAQTSAQIAATVHATRLRYSGMPNSRLWRFEDGQVNFGMVEVQPHDLTRVAFLDFATVHADDWLVAPLDVPRGTLVEMDSVTYRTTFNESFTVANGNTGPTDFELFTLDGPLGKPLRGLVVPPGGRTTVEGPPIEEVVFARDETANMVWAIEKRVEGTTGDPRERRLEGTPADAFVTAPGTDLTYRLERQVPPWWIPLVLVPDGNKGGFHLRKGSFTDQDAARGKILAALPFDLFEEEVPREGVVVRRVPSLARDNSGKLRRWIARRVSVATGEASSGLTWDSAERR